MLTDDEARELGERWIRAGGGWRAGTLARHLNTNAYPTPARVGPDEAGAPGWWPDLRDPATRGAALEVVRERYGAPFASLVNERSNRWAVLFLGAPVVFGATEAAALVAALEAAPVRT